MAIICDNAANNDTMLGTLALHWNNFDAQKNRHRCVAHIINLAVHEALNSLHVRPADDDEDAIDASDVDSESDDDSDGNNGDEDNDDNGDDDDNSSDGSDDGDDIDASDFYANSRNIEGQGADDNNFGDAEVHDDTTLGEVELLVVKVSLLLYVISFTIYKKKSYLKLTLTALYLFYKVTTNNKNDPWLIYMSRAV